MSLKQHAIWTVMLLVVGLVGTIMTEGRGNFFPFIGIGIIFGIVLGFRAVIDTFTRKPTKRLPTAKEQFKEAFGDDDNALRISEMDGKH
jgi:Na+/proline symporter